MKLNRVVVTGYGVTSPIGNTPEEFWNSLTTGKIGIGSITKFDHSDFDVHNAAEIQDFPFDKYFVKKDTCLLYTSPSPRDPKTSRMPSSA